MFELDLLKRKPLPMLREFLRRRIKPGIWWKVKLLMIKLAYANLRKMIGKARMNQYPVIVGNRNQTSVEGAVKGCRK